MWMFAIFLSNHAEELACIIGEHLMAVPIDDDVEILFYRRLNNGFDALEREVGILKIVILYHHSHGSPNHCWVPVLLEPLDCFLIIESRP